MKHNTVLKIFSVVAALLILFLAGISFGQPGEADAQVGSGVGNYDIAGSVIVHGPVKVADGYDLTLTDDLIVGDDITITGDLVGSSDLTLGDDLTVPDDVNIGGDLLSTRQTTVTVTSGGTVTPLGNYVPLSAAGNVGTSSIAGCTAGDSYSRVVTFINVANVTITFTDTGTLKLSSNAALGQWDSLTLRCHTGSGDWVEVGETNN